MGTNRKPGNRKVIKSNLKTSDRISVIYNDQDVEMYVADFKSFLNDEGYINSNNSGYTSFSKTLTQAEVRTLNSANSSYGIELLTAPGAGKVYAINNVYIKYAGTGGAFASADIWIYNYSQSVAEYMGSVNVAASAAATYYEHLVQEQDTYISANDPIYIYASVEQATYEGTWEVIFDYRIIDFN